MTTQRLEKKFVYENGDETYKFFIISGMFRKTFQKRIVNSIYFDTDIYQDVWDNINGFGNRKKIRIRWYNNLNNSKVFLEVKKKIGFVTQKKVEELGKFKNLDELDFFIKEEKYIKTNLLLSKKINLKKTLLIQYQRNYYELPDNKLRVTVDNNLKIYQNFSSNFINLDKTIIELKYDVKHSSFVNNFIKTHYLSNRNQKFSKYVNSFIEINENGYI